MMKKAFDFLVRTVIIFFCLYFILELLELEINVLIILFLGFLIETIRRVARIFLFNKKFKVNKHYLFWIITQSILVYISLLIANNFKLNWWQSYLLIAIFIALFNFFIKFLKLEKEFFKLFKHNKKKSRSKTSYYKIGLQSVPSDVLRGWRRSAKSKKEFKGWVESSGYKAVHGG